MDLNGSSARNIEWKIHNFAREFLTEGKIVKSSDFQILLDDNVTKWYLKIIIKDCKLGVFLRMRNSVLDDFTVKCELFFRALNDGKGYRYHFLKTFDEYKICKGHGWPTFISIEEIFNNPDQYLKNNTLKLRLKVHLVKNAELKKVDNAGCECDSRYLAIFKDYFDTKSFSDLTFFCSDSTEIQSHRFVVAAFSPVLKKMLDIELNSIIKVKDINGETMMEILRFIYTQKVDNIDIFAPKLLYGAEKFGLDGLKELCATSMIETLSVKNAVDYFLLADRYDIKDLLCHCKKFIKLNHQLLDKDENWDKLDKKQFVMLLGHYQQSPVCSLILESSF